MAEAWKISEAEAEAVVPKTGFLRDYIDYAKTATDAPLWWHIGSALSAMATCSGFRELRTMRSDGAISYTPIQFWNALVGVSGDRKSAAMDIASRLIHQVLPSSLLSDDGTVEAWHDALGDQTVNGVGFMYRDELSSLLDQSKRSYSATLNSWLLSAYRGGPLLRSTKSGGTVSIPRARLSILGAIPPDTLTRKSTKADWRSGFFTRFTFWSAERERYLPHEATDLRTEGELADWMKAVLLDEEQAPIVIPTKALNHITDWCYENVEKTRKQYPPDVFSALTRLQEKGTRIAAMFALSELDHIPGAKPIKVKEQQCRDVLPILELLHKGCLGMFNLVGVSEEHTTEVQALYLIGEQPGITVAELADKLGTTAYKTMRLCESLINIDRVTLKASAKSKRAGRPARCLYLTPSKTKK